MSQGNQCPSAGCPQGQSVEGTLCTTTPYSEYLSRDSYFTNFNIIIWILRIHLSNACTCSGFDYIFADLSFTNCNHNFEISGIRIPQKNMCTIFCKLALSPILMLLKPSFFTFLFVSFTILFILYTLLYILYTRLFMSFTILFVFVAFL